MYVLKVHIYNVNNPIKGLKIDMKVHINEIDSQNYYSLCSIWNFNKKVGLH